MIVCGETYGAFDGARAERLSYDQTKPDASEALALYNDARLELYGTTTRNEQLASGDLSKLTMHELVVDSAKEHLRRPSLPVEETQVIKSFIEHMGIAMQKRHDSVTQLGIDAARARWAADHQ